MTIVWWVFGGFLVVLGLAYLLGQWIGGQCDTEEEEVFPWDK